MLTHLFIADFTLVKQQEITFGPGLTVLTGETGAGKSILLDALALALGGRADAGKIRPGAAQAEVCASFDVRELPAVQRWLQAAELGDSECILRRILTAEGRSRAQINGRPVTQTQLRELSGRLLDLHSQNEHQNLMSVAHHRRQLDDFGKNTPLAAQVKAAFRQWQVLDQQLSAVKNSADEMNARYQLLRYQVDELDQLALAEGELEQLEQAQQQLANAEQIQRTCQQVVQACTEDDEALAVQVHRAVGLLEALPAKSARVESAIVMLREAHIQIEEAGRELEREAAPESDEYALAEVEERLSAIYEVARKHKVQPEQLFELHQQLSQEIQSLKSGDEETERLEQALADAAADYTAVADELAQARVRAAKKLTAAVNKQLQQLAMAHARFEVALKDQTGFTAHGAEQVEFLIATVPGSPAQPLAKVASGGELSRVSLAIQVVTAKTSVTPTLVFDEVDVGIGGTTGDVVGAMLRELGGSAQVLCVTHLAQVASKAHSHMTVEKVVHKKGASSLIKTLSEEDRVLEVARMMGGAPESEQSLAHAREMLEKVG